MIKDWLRRYKQESDRDRRDEMRTKLFDYLVENREFIWRYPEFGAIIREKLIGFIEEGGLPYHWHYEQIFGLSDLDIKIERSREERSRKFIQQIYSIE